MDATNNLKRKIAQKHKKGFEELINFVIIMFNRILNK